MQFSEFLIYTTTFIGLYTAIYFLLTLYTARDRMYRGEATVFHPVTIAIPCYNEEHTVEKTLRSLCELEYPKSKLEIIVVDDGSTDNTYKIAKAFAAKTKDRKIKVIKQQNGGKYTALNNAMKQSTGDFFGALDADSFVHPKALLRIMKYFENPKITAVTPAMKIHNPKGFLQRIQAIEYLLGVFLRKVFAELGAIHVTPGPFSIYRKTFFKKYGPFRKAYHTEDIELALRAQKNNEIIENALDAYVYTVGPNNFRVLYNQRIRWYVGFIKNCMDYRSLFSRKHGNLGLFILPTSFISVGLTILYLGYFLFLQGRNLSNMFKNFAAVNFDVSQMQLFDFDWFFIDVSSPVTVGAIAIFLSIFVIFTAKRIAKERPMILSYVFFAATYWVFFGYWWLRSISKVFIERRSVGWGHKSE